ncbi:MAG: DUF1320 domain-containing protein [Rikenellaceae bacterium]|nr:DUF1320 domain-containing protein [Rikenellaceae bacterium]
MAFINDNDYHVVIGENSLKVISQVSADIRSAAELQAQAEIAGYLNPKYDTTAIFNPENTRHPLIVMYTCDIALYHMSAAMPGKMGSEVRKERYDRAIRWLEGVANGKIVPTGLPLATTTTPDGKVVANLGSRFSSDKKQNNTW